MQNDTKKSDIANYSFMQTQAKLLSPAKKHAIYFLKSIIKFSNTNVNEKQRLNLAIKNKTFQKLTRDINKLQKSSKNIKPTMVFKNTINIIKKYDVNSHIEENPNK